MKPISVLRTFFAIAVPVAAWAQAGLPTGANVVAGSASFSGTANSMTVNTGSPRTVINYNTFNVAAGNSVLFNQPSSSSATLNRVLGGEGSAILGSVSSNGQIFLVNPNGIFVGAGGSFSGSSVYLSTGNISNSDFLGGNIRFDPPPPVPTICMDGSIDATDVIRFNANAVGVNGVLNTSGSIIFDSVSVVVPPPPLIVDVPVTPPLLPGTGTIAGSGGNLSLSGGTGALPTISVLNPPVAGATLTITGGTITNSASGAGSGGNAATVTVIPTIPGRLTPPVFIGGSATFPSTSPVLTVTNSNGSIINWQTFSVPGIQVVHFAQPSVSVAVLNRVLGKPVTISGRLTSNGKVWLVDSAGVLVDPSRVVSTDGLKLASVSIQTPNLTVAPAPPPPPTARPLAPSLPRGTSGLVDGTVTVRLSLVDAAPISLR